MVQTVTSHTITRHFQPTTEMVACCDGVSVNFTLVAAVRRSIQLHRNCHLRRLARRVITQLQRGVLSQQLTTRPRHIVYLINNT